MEFINCTETMKYQSAIRRTIGAIKKGAMTDKTN